MESALIEINIPTANSIQTDRRPVPDPAEELINTTEYNTRCLHVACIKFDRWLNSGVGTEWTVSLPSECAVAFATKYQTSLSENGWLLENINNTITIKPNVV